MNLNLRMHWDGLQGGVCGTIFYWVLIRMGGSFGVDSSDADKLGTKRHP